MSTLYLESVAGVAGDMFAAAFVNAGLVPAGELEQVPRALGLEGVEVVLEPRSRAALAATGLEVRAAEDADHHHHTHWRELDQVLAGSSLDGAARDFARRVFRLLAEAEGAVHGVEPESVGFHEVGAVDSLVDVAMAGVCVARVAASRVLASPVRLGRGTVSIAHGDYPVPPPASARLALGMPVAPLPEGLARRDVELSTPTGLAILKALAPEFTDRWPPGVPRAAGYGAGTMDLGPVPNVFRVLLLDEAGTEEDLPYARDEVVEIACNVDDQTPERTGWLLDRLLELGALDAWATPIVGKKSRPAVILSALVAPPERDRFVDWLLRASSTFGVRYRGWSRRKLVRRSERRETPAGPVRFEIGCTTGGETVKEKPELEDLRRVWRDDPGFSP